MARIEGREHWKPPSIERLAALAPRIHAVRAPRSFRAYRPYHDLETAEPPPWSSQPKLWERAYAVAEAATVDRASATFIHRDHHAGNVMWSYGRVSGVIDWVEACIGPPAVDFARARINLAAQLGIAAARKYAKCDGIEVDPVWDVVDACDCDRGVLPGDHATVGLEAFVQDALSELG
jgi:aminoglycoside phosphotransferase (APT) family kinase protein